MSRHVLQATSARRPLRPFWLPVVAGLAILASLAGEARSAEDQHHGDGFPPDFQVKPGETQAAAYDRFVEERLKHTYPLTAARMLAECGGVREGLCLDLGCGSGHLDVELAKRSNLTIIGVDIDPQMKPLFEKRIREAGLQDRVSFAVGDAQKLPFPDNHADLIVSRGMLIFVPDIKQCLREVDRVLKPTGVAFLGGRYLYAPEKYKITSERLKKIVAESGVAGARVIDFRGQWVKILGPEAPKAAREFRLGPPSGGAPQAPAARPVFNVRDLGAVPDGKTLSTAAIQQAIDRCAAQGGGTVRLPAGTWLTGTLYLDSDVTILLEKGATLLGSRDRSHYGQPRPNPGANGRPPFAYPAMLAGSNLRNVTIKGEGTIDGQGEAFRDKTRLRPKAIYLVGCRDVLVENVSMRNAGSWMQHYRDCDRLTLRGIRVFNHASYNNDGLNVDSCREVTITGCRVDSDDDAIVLKSLSRKPCENVTISNCQVSSHCNGIKMGTESGGGFKNIRLADCQVHSPRHSQMIYGRQRGLAGVALEIVDGGAMDNVEVSRITIDGVSVAIFVRLGNRGRVYEPSEAKPGVGTLRNVRLSAIVATNTSDIGCSITGLPGHPVENVTLDDVRIGFDGGGAKDLAERAVPERPESYPESTMFGTLPAYGFFCRHAKGLVFRNVELRTQAPDLRHAMVFDDVEDLVIDRLDAPCADGAAAVLRLAEVRNATVRSCRAPASANPFLRLEGKTTRQVRLEGNDLTQAAKAAEIGPEVPADALTEKDNRRAR